MASTTCYYGYVSGMLTAAALQPLDNIKMTLILPPQQADTLVQFRPQSLQGCQIPAHRARTQIIL